ncbi:MAG: hypothetical protein KF773_37955 [Deltaproteobacteria bacterium]|nr:hypothetical protein [Deltaproteobacteria bacterium]
MAHRAFPEVTKQPYRVQILVPIPVELDAGELVARLLRWRGDIAVRAAAAQGIALSIPTADLPLDVDIYPATLDAFAGALHEALVWSPAWPECRGQLMSCQASIVVALAPSRPVNSAALLLSFLMVLDTVLLWLDDEVRAHAVLHWIPAQQVLALDRYWMLRTELGPCGPAVNVRIANATGRPGELLADTIGLAELGLPDLQTVFTDRDPADVTLQLFLQARRLFVGDRLDCAWIEEVSLSPPERDALTLQLD